MILDKMSALLLVLALPLMATAQQKFPFTVKRDAKGALTRVELPLRTSIMAEAGDDTLQQLRASLRDLQAGNAGIAANDPDELKPTKAEEKEVYEKAKAYLKHDVSISALDDVRLDKEYAAAKSKLFKIELFRLLAAPNAPEAFDRETIVAEVVKEILGQGDKVLPGSIFGVFNFLVDQYVEALESRREFFQNQLLVELAYDHTLFTAKEKDLIRSSVFYSRISILNIPARDKARKVWATYGATRLAELMKPCEGFVGKKDKGFGQCFKVDGTQIVNRMVKKSLTSKSASLAFDSKKTTRVRDHRTALMLAKLGLALVPVPGLLKKPVSVWLSSQYIEQRKSEGFLYGQAVQQGQPTLSDWVLVNSANPIISK